MTEQSLKDKTVKGVAWSGIDNVVQYAVSFIVSVILARLLSPDDYGLLGIIAIFTEVCIAIINGGFGTALIRKKEISDDDYNTVFLINIAISLTLYIIIFFFSPLIAHFFGREELISLTRVSSLGMVIGGFALVQQTRLTKGINFKVQTKITIIASIASGVLGITMALLGFGVWSLVAQNLSCQLLRTIFLWVFNHWVPRLSFSKESFRGLFGFGWKMTLVSVIDTVWKQLYQVVIGKWYSPASLGQYTRANQYATLFSSNWTVVVQRVTFPVLSNIQDERIRMAAAYKQIIKLTMYITAICMLFLGAISEPFIYCLIGPKWHDAAVYLPLICISGSLYPLHALNLNMLEVQGRGSLFLILEIIKKIIAIGPIAVGVFCGIIPMLYAVVIMNVICFFINSHYSGKEIGYSSWMQVKDIAPLYGIAILIAIPVYFLKYLPASNWIILAIQVVIGFCLLFFFSKLFKRVEYFELKNIILSYMKRICNYGKKRSEGHN